MAEKIGSLFIKGPADMDRPEAKELAAIATKRLLVGETGDPGLVNPLYVRPPDIREPAKAPGGGQGFQIVTG